MVEESAIPFSINLIIGGFQMATVRLTDKVNDYLKELDNIKDFIEKIENPTVIYFNGFLAENRNIQNPDLSQIELTDYINFQVPYFLTRELSIKTHIKKYILYI